MSTDRKKSFKLPPSIVTDGHQSQNARRTKALEDQKRRRAQKFDATRQLDLFAELTLGPSDDEADIDLTGGDEPEISKEGLASFKSLLDQSDAGAPSASYQKRKRKPKRNTAVKRQARKPSKWADQCMYAELLEMADDSIWSAPPDIADGLPDDLETGWVAVAPVPVGKRCLAITHQSAGPNGIAPNTTLRSRLLGKSLMPRFPSSLPPSTILDCILDFNWRINGILHVLDVLKWKGQDVADCETPFRFWWRDTRLAELPPPPIPSMTAATRKPAGRTLHSPPVEGSDMFSAISSPLQQLSGYEFPYPTTLLAIPYHTDTSLYNLFTHVIPLARSSRSISVKVPIPPSVAPHSGDPSMAVDLTPDSPSPTGHSMVAITAHVEADGLLLYVAEAGYEAGTSPLSSWVPISNESKDSTDDRLETNRPLDYFEMLIKRRIEVCQNHPPSFPVTCDVEM